MKLWPLRKRSARAADPAAEQRRRMWQAIADRLEAGSAQGAAPEGVPIESFAEMDRPLLEACLEKGAQLDAIHLGYLQTWVLRADIAEADFAEGRLWEWLARPEAAGQAYRRCLERQPGHAKANNQLGLLLLARESWDEAIACFGRAVETDAGNAVFRNNLGIGLWQVGEVDDAIDCYRKAWLTDPDNPEIRRNLFSAAMEEDRHELAAEVVEKALAGSAEREASGDACDRDGIWPHVAQAVLVLQGGDLDRAEALYREVAARSEVAGLTGLGMVAVNRGRFEEALACFREVIQKASDNPVAYHNMAIAWAGQGDLGAALECLDRALGLAPKDPSILMMRAMIYLQTGRWSEGWRDYEARLRLSELLVSTAGFDSAAVWKGEPLQGRTLAIVGEQGAGDQIQFARFACEAAQRGAEVVVYCNPPTLKRLMESVPGVTRVCAPGEPYIAYDYWVAMLSMPRLLGIGGESLAPRIPYLFPDASACRRWAERLADMRGLRVGLVWAGSPAFGKKGGGMDRRRSLALDLLEPLWNVPGIAFFSLQKGPPRDQLAAFSKLHPIMDYSEEWTDFADTAAFIAALDLVISVDTSVAHLAGGLGKPVWILSRHDACWRWLENREDSPWYPTARVFRQAPAEGWGPVVRRVESALLDLQKLLD